MLPYYGEVYGFILWLKSYVIGINDFYNIICILYQLYQV